MSVLYELSIKQRYLEAVTAKNSISESMALLNNRESQYFADHKKLLSDYQEVVEFWFGKLNETPTLVSKDKGSDAGE